jgi:hypothetical protein
MTKYFKLLTNGSQNIKEPVWPRTGSDFILNFLIKNPELGIIGFWTSQKTWNWRL